MNLHLLSALSVAALVLVPGTMLTPTLDAADATNPPSSAELVRVGYLALVEESIVPADPRVVATAALASIATLTPERAIPLPVSFGNNATQDAAWLAGRAVDLPAPWTVLDAMARGTGTAHVNLSTPERRNGIRALMAGKPLGAPGFNLYPLADGRLVVFDVVPGASADRSGLRAGDVLLRVNGERALRRDVLILNTHAAGTELTLDIERMEQPATITLRLAMADVPLIESRLLDDGIGYVFIRWFAHTDDTEHDTAALARRAFASLAAQGARGLILDLRSSLGGVGDVSIASALCDGEVIYAVRQPLSAPARPVSRVGERCWPNRPIAVLVNEHTVSAGEALALALHELAPATIVGQTTGGALTEMKFVPLADGYAMAIPTGVVLGPISGTDQPGYALKPDLEESNPGITELANGRDRQLDAARALIANRTAAR